MVDAAPHMLIFSGCEKSRRGTGRWHFAIERSDGCTVLEASDEEPGTRGERLELLAVVRGLEALDQPSRVTLVTSSRHVARGIRYGLEEWRRNQWRWERDGRWVPIKNLDLWQRVDRALRFHQVRCRTWRIDMLADESPSFTAVPDSPTRDRAVMGASINPPVRRRWTLNSFADAVVSRAQAFFQPGAAEPSWNGTA